MNFWWEYFLPLKCTYRRNVPLHFINYITSSCDGAGVLRRRLFFYSFTKFLIFATFFHLQFAVTCFLNRKKNFSIFCVCIFINVHYQFAGRSLIVVKIICNQSASINYHVFFTNDHSDRPTALMITLKFVFARI